MALGYTDPDSSEFVKASSVQLRDKMRTSDDERMRKVPGDTYTHTLTAMIINHWDIFKTLAFS